MYNKISGVPESYEETKLMVRSARQQFRDYNTILVEKKGEYKKMKKETEEERNQLIKERKAAE